MKIIGLLTLNLFIGKNIGGAKNSEDMKVTTLEYYENIKNSDYVLVFKRTGNFSIRLYETLMMGRIPIFINTDCLLPFNNHIN